MNFIIVLMIILSDGYNFLNIVKYIIIYIRCKF
jgi:hypothetical protein